MDFGLGSYSSSSSSPPSSSSSQYKAQKMGPPVSTTPWEPQMSPNWLGNKYEPTEDDNEATAATATASTEADSTAAIDVEKVHLFDKVVTPSDVGKLNRLVIPKQHAERYFPMDSSTNEKGLLLNFEDRNGKPWRFRYSYWNSSQSYVMTKGWSRFVKDKKLESGDIVSFLRGVGESGRDRLFIDWKRRPEGPDPAKHHFSLHRSTPWSPLLVRPSQLLNPLNRNSFSNGMNHPGAGTMGGSFLFLRSAASQGGVVEPIVFDSVPVVQGKGAAKRLRLFGVNMECPVSDKSRDDCEILSTTTTTIPNAATMAAQNQQFSSSSSSSSQHPLQSRLYNGTPVLAPIDFLNANKGKTSSMSLDFDI